MKPLNSTVLDLDEVSSSLLFCSLGCGGHSQLEFSGIIGENVCFHRMRNTACFGVTLWFSKIHEAEEGMGYPLFNQAREKHHREGRKEG